MSSEEDKVIHSVDGIEEYDNALPLWWLYTIYGAVAFATVYWWIFHTAKVADLPVEAYQAELDRAAEAEEKSGKASPVTPESLLAAAQDPTTVSRGKQIFAQTCAQCHRADGGGLVGPNLTDDFWLHGAAPDKIWQTVSKGVPDKGMPAWKPQLGSGRVQAVTAYVLTLKSTNVPGGKAPQGDRDTLSTR
jgi:cytochrome c oxidase cbb3-type subunit 3